MINLEEGGERERDRKLWMHAGVSRAPGSCGHWKSVRSIVFDVRILSIQKRILR